MSAARLVAHQLHYDLLVAWRDPRSRFFALALPVIFLILLSSVFGDHATRVGAHAIKNSTYFLPGICTPHDLLILAIWAVAGLAVALWRFSWSPLAV